MKNIMKFIFFTLLSVTLAVSINLWLANKGYENEKYNQSFDAIPPFMQTSTSMMSNSIPTDFILASEKTVNAVVHVKNVSVKETPSSLLDFFYGYGQSKERFQVGTGSGVIISPDGYIITNNHVIEDAETLKVKLNNNKTYQAKVIGTDESTDIALLKVDAKKPLSFLTFGDSDNTKIGEWVLAVGNPFNLTSTVTAGIISAKSRDLNEYDSKNQSFIQTDAAVNPGNSGGALVNTKGELIGINTAISSSTGSYVGYSFAVPGNIAKKVVSDLIEYGNVHKGILGIRGRSLNSDIAEKLNINETEGVYVNTVEDFATNNNGIQSGDVIKQIDGILVTKFEDLTGYIFTKRPGDKVTLKVIRNEKFITLNVTLLKNNVVQIPELGLGIRDLTNKELKQYSIRNGVLIVQSVGRMNHYGLEGKVLLKVNKTPVENTEDVKRALSTSKHAFFGRISLEMINKRGEIERFIIQ